MSIVDLESRARAYLEKLCLEIPTRRVGTPGNRAATAFAAEALRELGWPTECPEFACIDWQPGAIDLTVGGRSWPVRTGPFSLGCTTHAPLVVAQAVAGLEALDVRGKLLLVMGDLVAEPLMPKGYPFFNPQEHQHIVSLLEAKSPAAVIAATGRHAGLAGGAYPFPLIEDGNFDLPTAYLTDEEGALLAQHAGEMSQLRIEANREAASGCNVIARRGSSDALRVVYTAHIDAKDDTPGALDNAAGVVVLLLMAEILRDRVARLGVELLILNGEDHYSAAGEVHYLSTHPAGLPGILVAVNIDAAGYREGRTAYSLYGCPDPIAATVRSTMACWPEMFEGEAWYQGDHGVFMQAGRPAVAITSEHFVALTEEITHTAMDRPDLVDAGKLVRLASALSELHAALEADQSV